MNSQISPTHRAWAEIDTGAILHNYHTIRSSFPSQGAFFAVIKANAYGHGDLAVASLLEGKADYFMVAELGEALHLRENGIRTPILVAGYTDPCYAPLLAKNNVTQCVYSLEYAKRLNDAVPAESLLLCHLKLDSGMGRLGFSLKDGDFLSQAKELLHLRSLVWEGVFSHFAQSEIVNDAFTKQQQELFLQALSQLKEIGFAFRYRHINNSAASLLGLQTNTNACRVGLSLYGVYPSERVKNNWESRALPYLRPAMKLKTHIVSLRHLHPGDSVGYNRRFVAQNASTVAVLPVGYADGVPRCLSGAPAIADGISLVGSVCMDMCFADVSKFPCEYREGDVVTLFGDAISVEAWAKQAKTIPYEIFCNLSSRVPRIVI